MIDAFNMLKDVAPMLWTDKVTIQATKKVVNEHHITTSEHVTVVKDEPGDTQGLKNQ